MAAATQKLPYESYELNKYAEFNTVGRSVSLISKYILKEQHHKYCIDIAKVK